MSAERGIYYDGTGIVRVVVRGSSRAPLPYQTADGLTLLAVAPDHDVLTRPGRWRVTNGTLAEKTRVTLAVSGSTVTAQPTSTGQTGAAMGALVAPTAVAAMLQLPNGQAAIADGSVTLATPPPTGWRIHIAHDDPTYYSDPLTVS